VLNAFCETQKNSEKETVFGLNPSFVKPKSGF